MINLTTSPALVCNPSGIAPNQREKHTQTTIQLFQSIESIRELEDGFEFEFASESSTIVKIAEFISNERLCCPFLKFDLEVQAESKHTRLTLTGPHGTKEFLRAEFSEIFPTSTL